MLLVQLAKTVQGDRVAWPPTIERLYPLSQTPLHLEAQAVRGGQPCQLVMCQGKSFLTERLDGRKLVSLTVGKNEFVYLPHRQTQDLTHPRF